MYKLSLLIPAIFLTAGPCLAAPPDYAGQDLRGKDFSNGNFDDANFQGANLQAVNLSNATCKHADFRNADLRGADLSQAMLEGADFTGAKLERTSLRDAKMHSVKLSGIEVDLAGAHPVDPAKLLSGIRVKAADGTTVQYSTYEDVAVAETALALVDRNSGGLSFEHADLRNTLILGNAEGVDFRFADLRGANLSQAQNVDKARFKGARYDASTRWNIDPAAAGAVLQPSAP